MREGRRWEDMVYTPKGGGRRVNPEQAKVLERLMAGQAACTGRGRVGWAEWKVGD